MILGDKQLWIIEIELMNSLKPIRLSKTLLLFVVLIITLISCAVPRLQFRNIHPLTKMTGDQFYDSVLGKDREFREQLAKNEILNGNVPCFMKRFKKIKFTSILNGKTYTVGLFVLPDYLSVGSKNFARIPLTPMTAQEIADSLHCFLPTTKIVDIIYQHAKIKLKPIPMYAFRDSSVTMYQHNLIIEGQRKRRKGLIAGIKKDVVMTARLYQVKNKVAIYGWHQLNGKPIQPLYTGHANWYVDYSHGIRLIYIKIKINHKWYDYTDVLKSPELHSLICDEEDCSPYHYLYQNY